MAIKRSVYNRMNDEGSFDELHFRTDTKMIEVHDSNKVSKGNLDELLFTGSVINFGSIKDIKISGKYRIKGLSDMPSGIGSQQECILEVVAIGSDINNPILISYVVTDENGYIFYRTVNNRGKDSGWSNGGTGSKNIINGIINSIGSVENLRTVESTLVGAINELVRFKESVTKDLKVLDNKDYDDAYIRKDKPSSINAELNLQQGKGINIRFASGNTRNLISSDLSGNVNIGHTSSKIRIQGSGDILYNGDKVWTERNDGKGSGLDADFLGGISHTRYLSMDSSGNFEKPISFSKGIELNNYERIRWKGVGSIRGSGSGGDFNILIQDSNDNTFAQIGRSSGVKSRQFQSVASGNRPATISMKSDDNDGGVTLSMDSKGLLKMINSRNGSVLMSVGRTEQNINFGNAIMVNGRLAFIQKEEPPKNVPLGSVWLKTDV